MLEKSKNRLFFTAEVTSQLQIYSSSELNTKEANGFMTIILCRPVGDYITITLTRNRHLLEKEHRVSRKRQL